MTQKEMENVIEQQLAAQGLVEPDELKMVDDLKGRGFFEERAKDDREFHGEGVA